MSSVKLWCLLICFWLSGTRGQGGEQCKGSIWELGEQQPIYCIIKNLTESITMQLKINNEFVNVSSCKVNGECVDYMSPSYTVTAFGDGTVDGEDVKYIMEVYINGVKKDENVFRCIIDRFPTEEVCSELFVRPSTPVCDPPTLVDSDTKLSISCFSEKVYPGAKIGIRVNGKTYLPTDYNLEVESKMSPSLEDPGYYVENSTVRIRLSSLKPNDYYFEVWMYPDISNDTLAKERGSKTTVINTVVLAAPNVRLSSECPVDSYVTSGTCKCELSTPGYPPGQARWYTQSEQEVGTENTEDRSSTIVFQKSEGSPASYECRAWTVLNVSTSQAVSFTPKFPFGPNSVIIESSVVDGTFDLCPSEEHITIAVTCKVPTDDVKPDVTFSILVNNDIVLDQQESNKIDTYYFQDYSFRPSKGGSYFVECRARNSLSSQLSPSRKLTFEVREPPTSSPVFHIPPNQQGSNVAAVEMGKTIDITCKVDGGYQKVSEVTITCGSKVQTFQSNIATLTLEVTQSMDGQICYCTATHDSGCYDKRSEVSLKVEEAREDQGSELDQTLIIVLPVTAAVIIVALVVVIIVLFMRKRKRTPAPTPPNNDYITPITPTPIDYGYSVIRDGTTSNEDGSFTNSTFIASDDYDQVPDVYITPSADKSSKEPGYAIMGHD